MRSFVRPIVTPKTDTEGHGLMWKGTGMSNELLIPAEEAARRLGIKRAFLYQILRSGELNRIKLGKRTLVHVRDLEQFADKVRGEA